MMLINSAKDVASALSHLINSAKNASGKQGSDPAIAVLKESAKVSCVHPAVFDSVFRQYFQLTKHSLSI